MPFDCARVATSLCRSTVSAAIASNSQRRTSRTRSELSASSSCLSSGESSNRPAIENESSGVSGSGAVDVALRQLGQAREQRERTLDVGRVSRIVLVGERLDAGRHERATGRQLEQPEPLATLDDDVRATVLEALRHLADGRKRPDLAEARRRPRTRFRTASPARGSPRSAPGTAARRCAAAPAPSGSRTRPSGNRPISHRPKPTRADAGITRTSERPQVAPVDHSRKG